MLKTCSLRNGVYQKVSLSLMRTYRQIISVICVIAITLALNIAPATASKSSGQGKNIIIVGGEIGYPPYSFLDEKGEPTGLSVELTRAIAKTMGINIEIRLTPWTEARNALENATIDIIPGMFYSEERAKIFDFSPPFSIVSTAIFARIHSPSVESIENTRDREIIVMRGEAMHDYVLKHRLTDRILLTETPADALRLLASGKGDYALVAQMPGFYWIKELKLSNITSVGPSLEPFENCFAVRKGNNHLLSLFTEGLSIINQTGEYQKISEKWLGVLEPTRINIGLIIKYAAIVLIPLIMLLALSLLWSWMLRSRVNIKTKELLESEEKYRLMAENMSDVISLMDMNLRFYYVSPSIGRLTGLTVEEAITHSIEEIVTPDSLIRIQKMFKEEIMLEASGNVDPSRSRIIEYEQYRKDRSIVWVESSCRFLRDKDQKPYGVIIISRDVTERKQAEEALRESLQRLEFALQGGKLGMWDWNPQDGAVVYNDLWAQMLEYRPDEVEPTVEFFKQHVHPEDLAVILDRLTGHVEGRLPVYQSEHRFRTKSGRWLWVLDRGKIAERDKDGLPVRVTGIIADITERKQAEQKLKESEERLELAMAIKNEGIWDWNLSTNKTLFDERYYTIAGYTNNEFPQNFKAWAERVHPEDLPNAEAAIQAYLSGQSDRFDIEFRFRHKDGSWMWIQGRGKIVERDENGVPLRMIGTHTDITERKRAEEDLCLAHEKMLTILDSIDSTVYVADMETYEILFMNRQMITDFGGDKTGSICFKEFRKNTEICDFCTNKQLIDGNGRASGVCTWHDHNPVNGKFYINHDRAIEWTDGRLVRMQIATDITDLKKMEAQLLQAQKMESVGRLAGGVAHDFNNMLGVILGHAELALEQAEGNPEIYSDLKEIQKAAQRSADLTRQLLTFARKQIITPRKLDLNLTVKSMLTMLRRLIGEDIDLAWKPAETLWPVKMDPSQIDQILANLCVNARDAIAGVGKLTIETGMVSFDEAYCAEHAGVIPGDFVLLSVSDDGCGMDKETLNNLFEPFFTTKEMGKGTGLGLAMIYGIVKQNNGFINVYSEPGQGSTFRIYLPRLFADEDTDMTVPEKKAPARGTETILLVEDEPAILRMTYMMLERNGYSVISAATPSQAMEKAKNHSGVIDLLMTDVVMPEMNGRDLSGQITDLYPDIRLLFMSGYTANVIAHQGVLDEGVAFIQKPFSMADLAEKIREVLDMVSDKNQG